MTSARESDREIIDEQIRYYERRAPEYDATSTPEDDPLVGEEQMLIEALEAFRPRGRILEVACGTGTWTLRLLEHSPEITAIDSSPAMLDLSRAKAKDPRIRYVLCDVFAWEPDGLYDVVFFANWLSHVPPSRFDHFWNLVRRALAPGGRVFFVDEAEDAWRHEMLAEEFVDGARVPLVRRRLGDGREFRVVKVFWNPEELQARLRAKGWEVSTGTTGALFWGAATPRVHAATLTSARLELRPLAPLMIEALLDDDREALGRLVTMDVPAGWPREEPEDRRMLEMRLAQLRARPDTEMWLVRALVDGDDDMVGHAGFHYAPAPIEQALDDPTYVGELDDAPGGVTEIGYTIFPAYRGRGLATEAAGTLLEWGFETMGIGGVIACTTPTNVPSIRVLERLGGFRQIGHCLDENGNRELVFRRDRHSPERSADV